MQLVGQDADGPQIHLLIVLLPLQQLRREVERRPAEGGPQFLFFIDRPSEIAQFDITLT